MIEIPETVRICDACGDMTSGENCGTCERLEGLYDAQFYAWRAAQLFGKQRRLAPGLHAPEAPEDDGLGAMRGASVAVVATTVLSVVIYLAYLVVQFFWPR